MNQMTYHPAVGQAALAFLKRPQQLLIDGAAVESSTGKRTEVLDPGTGRVIATVAEAGAADVDKAVAAARRAFEGPWRKVTPSERMAGTV